MKIRLPNGAKVELDESISLEQKIAKTKELTEEWHTAITINWDSQPVRFFLDGLANYLVWHKEPENKGKQEKEIFSKNRIEQMSGKRKGKSTPFSSVSKANQELLFGEVLKDV